MTDIIHKVSAGGVVYHQGQVLAIKWDSQKTIEFPKGSIEHGETKQVAAIREVLEETGYVAEIIESLGEVTFDFGWSDGKHYRKTVHYFLMNLVSDAAPTPAREANEDFENLWLTPEVASSLLSHDDSREILKRAMKIIERATKE